MTTMSVYFKKSLSRQVLAIMTACTILFLAGTGSLFYYQQVLNDDFIEQRKDLVEKRGLAEKIYAEYNDVFLNIRGYIAFNNNELKEQALSEEALIRKYIASFKKIVRTQDDEKIYAELETFTDYYYNNALPSLLDSEIKGNRLKITEIDLNSMSLQTNDFRSTLDSYSASLSKKLDENVTSLSDKQSYLWGIFIGVILLFLVIFQYIVRLIVRNIGKPLNDLSVAADEMAAGRHAEIKGLENRQDELGALSSAFNKMITSIQDKEQELMAHNEELLAQQDEMHAQQVELQETLAILTENEQKLTRRNTLIDNLSTSLDKDEVLNSIVRNMGKLMKADCGMITFVHEETHASFGISEVGVRQFLMHIHSGLNLRLLEDKQPFTVKREQKPSEMGFHETVNYSHDLFLPVFSGNQDVEAIMVFSRYATPFTDKEIEEYETLAKQIATSLDKIKLYEETEDNRRLNQDILNTVQEGIQLIDQDKRIVQVNQKFCDVFHNGLKPREIIGMPWELWSHSLDDQMKGKDLLEHLASSIEKAAQGSEAEENSFVLRHKDTNQVLKVYCETLNYREEAFGTILVYRDITREDEVDQMKSEFVSTVSHELRTPLASVLGFTELILHKPLKPERQKKYLETIYEEAKRLTALINDFLDIQRMESGRQIYEQKYVPVLPILNKIIEHLEVNAAQHDIRLEAGAKELSIMGDRSKIEQAFTNLIGNAIKYSPEGGKVSIRVYEKGAHLVVEVEDEGLGIPEESLPNLFQKFYRVDNSDRRRIGGTGLGLSIVDEIVKSHGGTVEVASEFGKGSRFTVFFPKVFRKEHWVSDETIIEPSHLISVIEDDSHLAELLEEELVDNGFGVHCYKSGKTALENLKRCPPDAIVLDILLEEGEMDGWKILHELKGNEELCHIPVFVSTALDERKQALSLGAKDYLVKPYKPSQLSKAILNALHPN